MLPLIPCCNAESIYSHARATLKAPISPLVLSLALLLSGGAVAEPQQGLAMHGAPAEPNGFTHFPYVNPDARKGGRVIFGVQGSFDSLNPLIVKGNPAEGLRDYLYESLLARANDEAFTLYGLIAESVETPGDRSSGRQRARTTPVRAGTRTTAARSSVPCRQAPPHPEPVRFRGSC